MTPARSIRRLGFRKWYERELLRSHANLVLLLLATLGLLASAEVYSARLPLVDQLQVLGGALASAARARASSHVAAAFMPGLPIGRPPDRPTRNWILQGPRFPGCLLDSYDCGV